MECTICGNKAVINRKYEGKALCKMHFCQDVEKSFRATIRKHSLIGKNDFIAVGFSGGKDSSVLLYLLSGLAKRNLNLKLEAIMVNEGIHGYREESIGKAKAFCEKLGVKLTIVDVKAKKGKTIDEIAQQQKELKPCSYCGVFRKSLLNETARTLGATKLAIGHNLDDEAQSIMANYIRGDLPKAARLGTTSQASKDRRFIPRIRPLIDIPEKEIALYAILKDLDVDFGECPYAKDSFRWAIRDMINDLEVKYPGTKFSIKRTFEKLQPALIEMHKGLVGKINDCIECGEPATHEVCKACELRKRMFETKVF